jgi:FixJ family two-component response regulator
VPKDFEIAVIDDDGSFRDALVESLFSLGYAADGFASAEDYIRTIKGRAFDCVVTDIHMPGISGLDLMKRLAARGSTTPVVFNHGTFRREPGGQSRGLGRGLPAQETI